MHIWRESNENFLTAVGSGLRSHRMLFLKQRNLAAQQFTARLDNAQIMCVDFDFRTFIYTFLCILFGFGE